MALVESDDWMIPRRLHTQSAEEHEPRPNTQCVTIDPEFLQRRAQRLQTVPVGPSNTLADEPWAYIDQRMASTPAFKETMWTLGDVARWVIERTAQAVDGLSIDEEKLFQIRPEIHDALISGEVSVFASTQQDPVPRELPAETWSVYDLVIEERDGLIRIFPSNSGSSSPDEALLNIRVKREDVLERWPDPANPPRVVPPTTAAAENQCRRWLVAMMRENLDRPRPKAAVREEAVLKFKGLGKRGFGRAWDAAIREANAPKWRVPGRRI